MNTTLGKRDNVTICTGPEVRRKSFKQAIKRGVRTIAEKPKTAPIIPRIFDTAYARVSAELMYRQRSNTLRVLRRCASMLFECTQRELYASSERRISSSALAAATTETT